MAQHLRSEVARLVRSEGFQRRPMPNMSLYPRPQTRSRTAIWWSVAGNPIRHWTFSV